MVLWDGPMTSCLGVVRCVFTPGLHLHLHLAPACIGPSFVPLDLQLGLRLPILDLHLGLHMQHACIGHSFWCYSHLHLGLHFPHAFVGGPPFG